MPRAMTDCHELGQHQFRPRRNCPECKRDRQAEERAAVLAMTPEQVRASWVREQEWNRAHGLPYYTVLRDVDHRIAERIPDA